MANLSFSKNTFLNSLKGDDTFYEGDQYELGAEQFLKTYYDDAQQNEALDVDLEGLQCLARDFWMTGNRRKVGVDTISVRELTGVEEWKGKYDVVEIVTDDRQFLVDSVIGEVTSHGIDIVALFHPVVEGFRSPVGKWSRKGERVRESMIQIIIRRQSTKVRAALKSGVIKTLSEVNVVNADFKAIVQSLEDNIEQLSQNHEGIASDVVDEAVDFLTWLRNGNFVFLGVRAYKFAKTSKKDQSGKGAAPVSFDYVNQKIVKDSSLGVMRDLNVSILRESSEPANRSSNVEAFLRVKDPVTVAKSNLFSRVHRRVRMDYVSIKHYNKEGQVEGETRFVGLFTSEAYSRSPKYVPLLRRKVNQVQNRYALSPSLHNAKRLEFVLSSYPRDELFQIDEDELFRIASGVAQAYDRPRTRIFVRNDPFKRFVSVLVFVPRENYNTQVRRRIGEHLKAAYNGRVSAFYPQYSDSPLARVHFIIGLDPDSYRTPDLNILEAQIANIAMPWSAGLVDAAEQAGIDIDVADYARGFSTGYADRFPVKDGVKDIQVMESLSDDNPIGVRVYSEDGDGDNILRAKFINKSDRLELSKIMPIFTNMNLMVAQETGYKVERTDGVAFWIHDYEMTLSAPTSDRTKLEDVFHDAFLAVWRGQNEDDSFNALIIEQNVDWRRIAFLRLIARYRKQSGLDPSEVVQVEALSLYPEITTALLSLFSTKFDPDLGLSMADRKAQASSITQDIKTLLDGVVSLDHDRVLRRMMEVMVAGLRTNFFIVDDQENPHPFISLKIDSAQVSALPQPKPYREIFVWSPRVEGVHLRFGPVARGGLRWSDRRDDFRTEVLGLVKAQQVKNAVIVPVGSKGGFFPKALPSRSDREAFQAEGIFAYTQFVSGLLDITDSYEGEGVRHPKRVIMWDDADPYLVVAADKGTATFSDIANGIANDYNFWLGDAFASGGSVGYDHKAMGITARGAWEAVKRHFREMGKDIQSEDFDVIGVGDMSGDVFGNGMLLSKHIRLLAAFDHRDVFIDPNPDPAKTLKERQRLFDTPRSTWQDFNNKLISKGGGVFSRSAKNIKLTKEIQKLTGLSETEVTPDALIHALLKAPCELLWFGGIGTYVKSSAESNPDVHDKANDGIRINGGEIKAKVVGEGANLGVTQAGRIEFALSGGRINTDAIDNSAGVDCSDNEVNIKILLSAAIETGELKADKRVKLLESMTDNVAELVLQHNYDQTGSLSLAEARAISEIHTYARFMTSLEDAGLLDRTIEGLPSDAEINARADEDRGLTRPEIAVLNAYAKIVLFDDLMASDLAKDPYFDGMLRAYFPKKVQGFEKAMHAHRLHNEIVMSRTANLLVDVGGALFMYQASEQTNASPAEIARAFIIAYEVLGIAQICEQIAALDNQVSASAQTALQEEIAYVLNRLISWLVRRAEPGTINDGIAKRAKYLANVDESWVEVLSSFDNRRVVARIGHYQRAGIPKELSQRVSLLRTQASGFDVVELADKTGWPIRRAAELFYSIGGRFKIDRLRALSMKYVPDSHWDGLAQQRINEEFYACQSDLALKAANMHMKDGCDKKVTVSSIIDEFVASRAHEVDTYESAFTKLNASGGWTLSKFTIISAHLRELLNN